MKSEQKKPDIKISFQINKEKRTHTLPVNADRRC
jgi:hypothetical protein